MTTEIFILLFLFILGLCIGSFANAFNWRYVENKSILFDRSECPNCSRKLSAPELLPILSFLFQKGRCKGCQQPIPIRYPLVELAFGFSFAFSGWWLFQRFVQNPTDLFSIAIFVVFTLFIISAFLATAAADFSWGIIPDRIVIPAILITLGYKVFDIVYRNLNTYFALKNDSGLGHYFLQTNYLTDIVKADLLSLLYAVLIGLGIAAFFLLLIFFTKGRAMGLGDVKLGFLLGLVLGWPLGLVGLFLAFLTGALASVMLILVRRKSVKGTIPFGPFLSLGAIISLFYGSQILDYYLNLMR